MSTEKNFTVFAGYKNETLVYVGSTTQKPNVRFNWLKSNGKRLEFKILQQFDNVEDMLKFAQLIIDRENPKMNKRRIAICNSPITDTIIESRYDNPEWCISCFSRRVSPDFLICYWCSKGTGLIDTRDSEDFELGII